jgi:hypothetical protein
MRGFRAGFNSFHRENIHVSEELSGAVHHGIYFGFMTAESPSNDPGMHRGHFVGLLKHATKGKRERLRS